MQVHPSRRALVPQPLTNAAPTLSTSARNEEELRARLKERHANDDGRADWKRLPERNAEQVDQRPGQGGDRPRVTIRFERQDDFMPLGGDDRPGYGGRDVKPQGGRYYDDRQPRQEAAFHGGGGGGGGYRGHGGGISGNDLAARRAQRDASTVSVWPKSPERSYEELLARDTGKDRKRDRKHKHRRDKKSSKKHRKRRDTSSSEESSDSDTDDSREQRRRKRKRDEKRHRSLSPDPRSDRRREKTPPKISDDVDDDSAWVVKGDSAPAAQSMSILGSAPTEDSVSSRGVALAGALARADGDDEEDEEVGPQLPVGSNVGGSTTVKYDSKAYAHMRPGEGAAMAAFAADGQRIPRRGEIGLTSEEIDKYEQSGYVMSGSRHRRMNAVRMRKENQIISSEKKRAILKLQKEEKDKREAMIRESFKGLIEDKLAGGGR
ncbi:hypothetical protein QFC20_007477 [Naganishia adeliensis]|uniref:Uncharacterized protein n=1 Tax=Naganishia adeliensis TaxID=92952 RepID=A0ACC2UZ73_9TREE|nr:hypothetical protein QFC20_007477 [Naganishia adeliensis]